ncbi:MAG: hypothetical protein RSD49_11995 [Hafnia sp.]
MLKIIRLALVFSILAGCSTFPDDNYVDKYPFGKLLKQEQSASSIQWNSEYAVTAKHVTIVDTAYSCDSGCDLQFFKQKAQGPVPEWRDVTANEQIVASGWDTKLNTAIREGQDLNHPIISDSDKAVYFTNNALVVGGMSGGPVYGIDGKVLGMTVGVASLVHKGKKQKVSVYIPREVIQKQWDKFMATQIISKN